MLVRKDLWRLRKGHCPERAWVLHRRLRAAVEVRDGSELRLPPFHGEAEMRMSKFPCLLHQFPGVVLRGPSSGRLALGNAVPESISNPYENV